jgi:hypothetical protein
MPTHVPKNLGQGQLAASTGDLYTVPASTNALVSLISLVNIDTVSRVVNLYVKVSGQTARRVIPKDLSLGAGFLLEAGNEKAGYTLGAGDKIQGDADVASKVDFIVSGVEQT